MAIVRTTNGAIESLAEFGKFMSGGRLLAKPKNGPKFKRSGKLKKPGSMKIKKPGASRRVNMTINPNVKKLKLIGGSGYKVRRLGAIKVRNRRIIQVTKSSAHRPNMRLQTNKNYF